MTKLRNLTAVLGLTICMLGAMFALNSPSADAQYYGWGCNATVQMPWGPMCVSYGPLYYW